MSLQDFRNQYPEYDDIPDDLLVQGLYKQYGESETPEFFAKSLGYQPPAPKPVKDEGGIISDIPKSLVRGLDVAGESIGGAMEMLGVPGGKYVKELYGERAKRPEIAAPEKYAEGTVLDEPGRLTDARWWVNTIGENLPNMLMMMAPGAAVYRGGKALGMGTKAAIKAATGGSAVGAFGIESGAAYNEAKSDMLQMGYKEDEADKIATIEGSVVGVVNSLLEVAPFSTLLKNPGSKKILGRVIRQAFWEGGTEAVQENVNMVAAQLGHKPDTNLKDWIGQTIEAGLAGMALGGGVAAVVKGAGEEAPPKKPPPEPEGLTTKGVPLGEALQEEAEKPIFKKRPQPSTAKESAETFEGQPSQAPAAESAEVFEKYGLEIIDTKAIIPPNLLKQAQGIINELNQADPITGKKKKSAQESAEVFANFLEENQSMKGKIGLKADMAGKQVVFQEKVKPERYKEDAEQIRKTAADRAFWDRAAKEKGIEPIFPGAETAETPTEAKTEEPKVEPKGEQEKVVEPVVEPIKKEREPDITDRPKETDYYPFKTKSVSIENDFNRWVDETNKDPLAYKYNKENSSADKIDAGYNTPITYDDAIKQLTAWDKHVKSNAGRLKRGGKAGFNVSPTETLKTQWMADKLRDSIRQWRKDFKKDAAVEPTKQEPQKPSKRSENVTKFKGDLAEYTGVERDVSGKKFYEIKILEGANKGNTKLIRRAPKKPRASKKSRAKDVSQVKNLFAAVKKLGYVKSSKFTKAETREVDGNIKRRLFRAKTGLNLDIMEQILRDEGWLDSDEALIDALKSSDRLNEGRRTRDIGTKKPSELTEKDKAFKKELEHEAEEPPEGNYVLKKAGELPTGKDLNIIDRSGEYDEYRVIKKDEFGITLQDGKTINLAPETEVEVRDSDLTEKPTLELKGEKAMGAKEAELRSKKRTQSAGRQEGLGLIEPAPKGDWFKGEKATKKEGKAFEKTSSKKRDKLSIDRKRTPQQRLNDGLENLGIGRIARVVKANTKDKKAVVEVGKQFGIDIQFFRGEFEGGIIGGMVNSNYPDTLYINVKNKVPVLATAGHELLHTLEHNQPDLYEFYIKNLVKYTGKGFDKYLDFVNETRRIAILEPLTRLEAFKEFASDFAGDAFVDPNFYSTLHEANPTFAMKIAKIINDVFSKIARHLSPYGTKKNITQLENARKVLATVLSEYGTRQGKSQLQLGRGSGRWKKSLDQYQSYMASNPDATTKQIVEDTGLSEYEIETLSELDKTQSQLELQRKESAKVKRELSDNVFSAWKSVGSIWKSRKRGWKPQKADTKAIDRILSVPSHYFEKVPGLREMFEDGQERSDNYQNFINALQQTKEGESLLKRLDTFKKQEKIEYKKLKRYLIHRDQNQIGYRVELDRGFYKLYDLKGKLVKKFDSERTAWDEGIRLEASDLKQAGYSDQAAESLIAARQITNNGFDLLSKAMRDVEAKYKKAGMSLPVVPIYQDGKATKVDLKKALSIMGSHRGYYMPRIRKSGRFMLTAKKKGEQSILEFYDFKTTITTRQIQLERQGYEVAKDLSKAMPEDVFQMAGEIVAMQAVINEGLAKAKTEIDKTGGVPADFQDITTNIEELFAKSVAEQIANIFKGRGFRQHMIKRSAGIGKDVWIGYETDPALALGKYVRGLAAGEAKKHMALNMLQHFTGTWESWQEYKQRIKEKG